MIEIKEKAQCCGCSACFNICPKNAIIMKEDDKGFKYPFIDKDKCINCKLCEKVCPIINSEKIKNEPKAYACINKDDEVRRESSSGGIFTLLAEEIIELHGIVFGAAFDENFNVTHIGVDNKENLKKLRGSKYLQSDIGESYRQAKENLLKGKYVLYTGTPCQIEGLKSYLQNDYENLFTQDIICHGVPSKKVWQSYLKYSKKEENEKIKSVNFRNKKDSWENYALNIEYSNYHYNKNHNDDLYMKAFLQDVTLRDSCYRCSFKKYNRISDVTLADFWGISKINPSLNDHKGISLVIINSEKGKKLLEKIKNKCIIEETNMDEAIKYNKAFITSARINQNRENFYQELSTNSNFKRIVKKYTTSQSFIKKAEKKCKNIIKRVIKR